MWVATIHLQVQLFVLIVYRLGGEASLPMGTHSRSAPKRRPGQTYPLKTDLHIGRRVVRASMQWLKCTSFIETAQRLTRDAPRCFISYVTVIRAVRAQRADDGMNQVTADDCGDLACTTCEDVRKCPRCFFSHFQAVSLWCNNANRESLSGTN
jgi:hypothetical protein